MYSVAHFHIVDGNKGSFRAQEWLERELPPYFLSKPDEYSIDDLVNVKNGELKRKLMFLVDVCLRHTSKCKVSLVQKQLFKFANLFGFSYV